MDRWLLGRREIQVYGLSRHCGLALVDVSTQGGFCFHSHKAICWYNAIPDELIPSFSQKGVDTASKGISIASQTRDWHILVQARFLLSLGSMFFPGPEPPIEQRLNSLVFPKLS